MFAFLLDPTRKRAAKGEESVFAGAARKTHFLKKASAAGARKNDF
jgi:hypothetical protein